MYKYLFGKCTYFIIAHFAYDSLHVSLTCFSQPLRNSYVYFIAF